MGLMKHRSFQRLEDVPGTKQMAASGPNFHPVGSPLVMLWGGKREVAPHAVLRRYGP
jgi:hypothetical protein